jgi:hypothetical protein
MYGWEGISNDGGYNMYVAGTHRLQSSVLEGYRRSSPTLIPGNMD